MVNDIELDVRELKFLLDAIAKESNEGLREIAQRRIQNIHFLLDQLWTNLEQESAEKTTEIPKLEMQQVLQPVILPDPVKEPEPEVEPIKEPESDPDSVEEPDPTRVNDNKEEDSIVKEERNEVNTIISPLVDEEEVVEYSAQKNEDLVLERNTNVINIKEKILVNSDNSSTILAERLKPVGNIRDSLSLNDSFRFSRELFSGNMERMNHVLAFINEMSSLKNVMTYLDSEKLDKENEAYPEFMEILQKYFN